MISGCSCSGARVTDGARRAFRLARQSPSIRRSQEAIWFQLAPVWSTNLTDDPARTVVPRPARVRRAGAATLRSLPRHEGGNTGSQRPGTWAIHSGPLNSLQFARGGWRAFRFRPVRARSRSAPPDLLRRAGRDFRSAPRCTARCSWRGPGQIVSKDDLLQAGWKDVAVGDNSLEQAISSLRRLLGARSHRNRSAARLSLRRRGGAPGVRARPMPGSRRCSRRIARSSKGGPRSKRSKANRSRAHEASSRARCARVPEHASAHIGLASACVMQFEMTRADAAPDRAALARAAHHAREACRLDPQSGEAWATLGFVLDRAGDRVDALAASKRAVTLEPDNWRHHFRLSFVSWGEERLRAAHRTLALLPDFPLAHWLAATVHVARQVLSEAERELTAGLAVPGRPAEGRFALQLRRAALAPWSDSSRTRRRGGRARRIRARALVRERQATSTRANVARTRGTRSARSSCDRASSQMHAQRSGMPLNASPPTRWRRWLHRGGASSRRASDDWTPDIVPTAAPTLRLKPPSFGRRNWSVAGAHR